MDVCMLCMLCMYVHCIVMVDAENSNSLSTKSGDEWIDRFIYASHRSLPNHLSSASSAAVVSSSSSAIGGILSPIKALNGSVTLTTAASPSTLHDNDIDGGGKRVGRDASLTHFSFVDPKAGHILIPIDVTNPNADINITTKITLSPIPLHPRSSTAATAVNTVTSQTLMQSSSLSLSSSSAPLSEVRRSMNPSDDDIQSSLTRWRASSRMLKWLEARARHIIRLLFKRWISHTYHHRNTHIHNSSSRPSKLKALSTSERVAPVALGNDNDSKSNSNSSGKVATTSTYTPPIVRRLFITKSDALDENGNNDIPSSAPAVAAGTRSRHRISISPTSTPKVASLSLSPVQWLARQSGHGNKYGHRNDDDGDNGNDDSRMTNDGRSLSIKSKLALIASIDGTNITDDDDDDDANEANNVATTRSSLSMRRKGRSPTRTTSLSRRYSHHNHNHNHNDNDDRRARRGRQSIIDRSLSRERASDRALGRSPVRVGVQILQDIHTIASSSPSLSDMDTSIQRHHGDEDQGNGRRSSMSPSRTELSAKHRALVHTQQLMVIFIVHSSYHMNDDGDDDDDMI
jgi:hypothetical protein